MRIATEKQVTYINDLLQKREWTGKVDIAELTIDSASDLIDKLLNAPKKLTEAQMRFREESRLAEEERARLLAEELANCERCKNPAGGPSHGSCLYGGMKMGHSRAHCTASACF